MQEVLDNTIHATHNVTPDEIATKRVCALLVELGEFANEIAPFKYWKKNKTITRDKVVEEYVDGIHFLTSLGIYTNASQELEPLVISQDQTEQLNAIFLEVSKLSLTLNKENVEKAYSLYLGMAIILKLPEEEILSYYKNKNRVNFERMENNY